MKRLKTDRRIRFFATVVATALPNLLAAGGADGQPPYRSPTYPKGAPHSSVPMPQTKLMNPIAATQGSVESGRGVYMARCASCHGDIGKGDGKAGSRGYGAETREPSRRHLETRSTDGDIFAVISDGVPDTGMVAFSKNGMTTNDIWNVVNYMKTLRPR